MLNLTRQQVREIDLLAREAMWIATALEGAPKKSHSATVGGVDIPISTEQVQASLRAQLDAKLAALRALGIELSPDGLVQSTAFHDGGVVTVNSVAAAARELAKHHS